MLNPKDVLKALNEYNPKVHGEDAYLYVATKFGVSRVEAKLSCWASIYGIGRRKAQETTLENRTL